MRSAMWLLLTVVLGVCFEAGPSACLADDPLPPEQTVEGARFDLHETPDNPSSPVLWTIDLLLTEDQTDGNSIGWSIDAVVIRQFDDHGTLLHQWTDNAPDPNTPDGLWWIEHADPEQPVLSEFTEPPWMEGLAVAQPPFVTNLQYYLEGAFEIPTPPPFENTAALNHELTLNGAGEPETEGDGVVMEVLPTERPPGG